MLIISSVSILVNKDPISKLVMWCFEPNEVTSSEYENESLTHFMPWFLSILHNSSKRRSLSYRNQSIDSFCKSVGWFLYNRDLRYERVKKLYKGTNNMKLVNAITISC